MIKKIIALALLAVFVLVFMLEAGYGSNIQAEQSMASCPGNYIALSTPEGNVCVEKSALCGCGETYIIVDASSEEVVCKDLAPVSLTLGGPR
jgi:hypothetical protein